jgi:two-component sensor histidine kinase
MPLSPELTSTLGMALIMSSDTPLVLLDEKFVVKAASGSFCNDFSIDPKHVVGIELFALGSGVWDVPQLRSLLKATASGDAAIQAYHMTLGSQEVGERRLIVNAHLLDLPPGDDLRLVVAISDVTRSMAAEREKDALLREKQVLLQELNHRVANSLQIIASLIMLRVRNVQSEEARTHLRDAHHRVMSIATLQRQLASTAVGEVALRPYLEKLCASISASMIFDPDLLSLTVQADDSIATADQSVSIGLIVTELVINALKHAFPDPSAGGAITVGYHAMKGGWALTIADDGVGLPNKESQSTPGLGTGIVNALAAQLSATVEVAGAEPGTVVSVIHRE